MAYQILKLKRCPECNALLGPSRFFIHVDYDGKIRVAYCAMCKTYRRSFIPRGGEEYFIPTEDEHKLVSCLTCNNPASHFEQAIIKMQRGNGTSVEIRQCPDCYKAEQPKEDRRKAVPPRQVKHICGWVVGWNYSGT